MSDKLPAVFVTLAHGKPNHLSASRKSFEAWKAWKGGDPSYARELYIPAAAIQKLLFQLDLKWDYHVQNGDDGYSVVEIIEHFQDGLRKLLADYEKEPGK